jgi:hypothetical protein
LARFTAASLKASSDWSTCFASRKLAGIGATANGRNFPKLRQVPVLIVPSANPDGRARCRFDSWVGEELATNERAEMGTKPDGSNYQWPAVKRIHPMRGAAVGTLGAYFNDDGINLMHDEWFDPMAAETRAYLKLAREEAPISLCRCTRTRAILRSSPRRTSRALRRS